MFRHQCGCVHACKHVCVCTYCVQHTHSVFSKHVCTTFSTSNKLVFLLFCCRLSTHQSLFASNHGLDQLFRFFTWEQQLSTTPFTHLHWNVCFWGHGLKQQLVWRIMGACSTICFTIYSFPQFTVLQILNVLVFQKTIQYKTNVARPLPVKHGVICMRVHLLKVVAGLPQVSVCVYLEARKEIHGQCSLVRS